MNRINPETVLQAYQQTNFYPIRDAWTLNTSSKQYACPLNAIVASMDKNNETDDFTSLEDGVSFFAKKLSLPKKYLASFIHGFDSHLKMPRYHSDIYSYLGELDGIATRKALTKTYSLPCYDDVMMF